jgi:hypothetical protein
MVDLDREIWEGWTPRMFIDELEMQVDMIQASKSWHKPFKSGIELCEWLRNNQPYYKKPVPEVEDYFLKKCGLTK